MIGGWPGGQKSRCARAAADGAMHDMDPAHVRDLFDSQVRRSDQADGSGALVEADEHVVRWVAAGGQGWSGITWSELDEGCADAVIAAQVAYFAGRGHQFEWKLYDYDRPAGLADRLTVAGLRPGDAEALMVAKVRDVPQDVPLPAGVRLVPVTEETGVGLLIEVHERVFGTDHSQLRRSLLTQLRTTPEVTAMVVAMAEDEPVCSARIEFLPGREFASIWGGATLPGWRRKGIYRALVAYRARLAAARGYRFLQVDASSNSQPILARLGFVSLARTTPFAWAPPAPL
jgi:GNAT superfamily N-acetyltransferase